VEYCLSLGPNYNHGTQNNQSNIITTIKNTENLVKNIPQDQADTIRNMISKSTVNIINYKKTPKELRLEQFHSVALKQSIHFRKNNEDLVITKADKGQVTVILYEKEYTEKAMRLLDDNNTYTKLPKDPTRQIEKQVRDCISKWHTNKLIDDKTKDKLIVRNSLPPKIYFLPKIHKKDLPLRPIVSSIQSPTYNLSKHLSNILSNITNKKEYSIHNSIDFKNKIKNKIVSNGHAILSLDVSSLFTNIPTDLVTKLIKKHWIDIKEHTTINLNSFIKGTELCLNTTYFQFENNFFKQIFGCAMGTPLSATVANLVMEELEDECLRKLKHKPSFYYRFVDDIIITYPKDELNEILTTFNSYHNKLKFTIEIEKDNTIPFLDTKIIKQRDNTLKFDWYHKDTHSWRYINYYSNHHIKQKINTIKNLTHTMLNIADPEYRQKHINNLIIKFKENNYPHAFTTRYINIAIDEFHNGKTKPEISNDTKFLPLPYINTKSKMLSKILKPFNIVPTFCNNNKNNLAFSNKKSKTNITDKSNIVYSIPCECGKQYIGTTSQKLNNRLTQHKSDNKLKPNATALSIHSNQFLHKFDYTKTKVLDSEPNYNKRLISEAIHIKFNNNSTVNHKTDTQLLKDSYLPLLINRSGNSHNPSN